MIETTYFIDSIISTLGCSQPVRNIFNTTSVEDVIQKSKFLLVEYIDRNGWTLFSNTILDSGGL